MGKRRQARECALQVLFQLEFHSGGPREVLKSYWAGRKASREAREYGTWIVERILENGAAIDRRIESVSTNWRLARMAVIDRNILRIAVAELLYEPTLVPAIIMNEAIEIAKRYSGEGSAVFVNGVLDAVVRKLAETAPRPEAKIAREGEHEPQD